VGNDQAKTVAYNSKLNGANDGPNPGADEFHYYVLESRLDPVGAPAPLPLLGAGAAFGWSRRLRRRLKGGLPCRMHDTLQPASSERLPARLVFCDARRR